MNIQYLRLDQITPYHNNPRKNKTAIKYVKKSLQEFGWRQPIVVDKDMVIIVGHTRYFAAMELGYETAPVHIADLTPEQAKAYRLADNKTAEYSQWDAEKLLDEVKDLKFDNMFDMSEFGFTDLSSIDDFFRAEPAPLRQRDESGIPQETLDEDADEDEIISYSTRKDNDAYQNETPPAITDEEENRFRRIICPFCGKEIPA